MASLTFEEVKTFAMAAVLIAATFGAWRFHASCREKYAYSFFEAGVFGWWGVGVVMAILGVSEMRNPAPVAGAVAPWLLFTAGLVICAVVVIKNFAQTGLVTGAIGTALQLVLWPFAVALIVLTVGVALVAFLGFRGMVVIHRD